MKKLIPLLLFVLFAATSFGQTATFTVTTAPCNHDGVLTANFTGLTPPLTVTWTTYGSSGTTTTHTGVTSLTDALTGYSGGPVEVFAAGGGSTGSYFPGAPPFTYTITPTDAICPALGSMSAAVTGGTSPYTYQWYDESTSTIVGTVNPVSVPAGSYGVTITDAHGCVFGSRDQMDSVAVYSIAPFSVPVTSTVANCTNGTATVGTLTGGTTPYSYHWSTGATTSSIGSLVMGGYSVDVTDGAGCTASGYTYVNQSITISAPVTPTPASCTASDGAVIAFGSGGLPPYTYLWSNSATTQSQTGLAAGSYDVTVTDANGCIGTGYGYVNVSTPITASYTATASLCTAPTGSATLTLAGGTTPYSTVWYSSPVQTGVTATALDAGDYYFHVTDAAGCVQSGVVTIPPVDVISASFSATSALCATATGGLAVTPSGGTTPYTYSWSTGATGSSISGVVGGYYTVDITDHSGCTVHKYAEVPINSPLTVGLSATDASCIFTADGSITATPAGGTTPYTYSWSTGGTTSTISSLMTGPYWLSVSDAAGCRANWLYDYVGYNSSATSCYCTISGTIYDDVNGNCSQDAGEAGIPNIQVYCSGIGYTYTDLSGHYSFIVPSGSYIISETVLAFYPLSSCQINNIPVTAVASSGCTHTVDFANSIATIHDTHISTWDYDAAIPGHTYDQVVIISNEGTVTESSILNSYKTDGQLLTPTFVPGSIFASGSNYYNTAAGFPTLNPGYSESFLVSYSVPTGIPLGTAVVFKDTTAYTAPVSNWLTDYSPWNNVNYFTTYVVGSYDPNFKEVSPKGRGAAGIIFTEDSVLDYMVHFQNTGTAPAENIVVIDTLDNNLDWNTLRPVYMSSKCQVTLTQSGSYKIAKFTFPDINLPTASSEPITSNGMFTYTIHTKAGLPLGSTFQNSASIYFDYNAPIKTNKTLNTLGSPAAITPVAAENSSFLIYPNPAQKNFNAVISSTCTGAAELQVSDVAGRVLMTKNVTLQNGSQTINMDASQMAPGVYFVTCNQNGHTQTQKLIIMK